MATLTALPSGARPEHRGLSFWMDRVVKELEKVRSSREADAVHDLRVAIRRCRSVAAVMEEVDLDPAWPAMQDRGLLDRKSTRLNSSHQIISYAVFCLKKKND